MSKDQVVALLRELGGSATSRQINHLMLLRHRIVHGGTGRALQRLHKEGVVAKSPIVDPESKVASTLWTVVQRGGTP